VDALLEEPPEDPGEWTEEQWLDWLATAPVDPETGRAHPISRAASSPSGVALGAAMLGMHAAIFGDRPKTEIVAEVPGDGLDDGALRLDLEDPARSRIRLAGDG
jgi:hypothetical protein